MTYVGDTPAGFVVEPPNGVDLEDYEGAEAILIDPAGHSVELRAALAPDAGQITLEAGESSPFPIAGVYRLRVVVTAAALRTTLPEVRLVVQDLDDQWHTLDSVRAVWADAELIPDVVLHELLQLAREQVLEFATTLEDEEPVPSRYRTGQRLQARNIWNAAKVAPSGSLGEGEFTIAPYPLDWHVKQTLRPKRGMPAIG